MQFLAYETEYRPQGWYGCLADHNGLHPPSCPLSITPGEDGDAPEGNIVQAHACQHDQQAIPQHPLVVFVLLLPQLRSLRPHAMKLGPVLCIGGCPGAAGREKGVWGSGSPGA